MTATKPTNPKDAIGVRKVPMSCVPAPVVAEVALALLEGACKYGRHNYRAAKLGVRASVYYDATMRHLMAWWEGEDIDPDSGLSHVAKAIASLVVLRDAMRRGNVIDDRPPASELGWVGVLSEIAGDILDRYPVPLPAYTEIECEAFDTEPPPAWDPDGNEPPPVDLPAGVRWVRDDCAWAVRSVVTGVLLGHVSGSRWSLWEGEEQRFLLVRPSFSPLAACQDIAAALRRGVS